MEDSIKVSTWGSVVFAIVLGLLSLFDFLLFVTKSQGIDFVVASHFDSFFVELFFNFL